MAKEYGIIAKNLKLMTSSGKCSMPALVVGESIAGNAGTEVVYGRELECYAANFYYNKQTGEILCFTNDINSKFRDAARGTFRICADLGRGYRSEFTKIVKVFFDNGASAEANVVIQESANIYSSIYTGLLR